VVDVSWVCSNIAVRLACCLEERGDEFTQGVADSNALEVGLDDCSMLLPPTAVLVRKVDY
jgi:hypothetical protein